MTTIRFGTSCGPSARNSFREANPHWEDDGAVDDIDADRPVQCPFDKNHVIRTCRFAYHIQKCEKNNPELAAELVMCPYNAQHRMLKHEMDKHVNKCVNRKTERSKESDVKEVLPKFQVPVNRFSAPKSEEDWETESDYTADTFVWGKPVSTHTPPQNGWVGPKPSTTKSATPGLRLPSTLPWKN
ncbi:gametocyte-specific factor 1-like [Clupea harengus]|uniref:Gametocyte-specific factor 1-like n=1 Tax=Clupea harengus TaxID=7950 RepID=A0A6P3W3G0_CLUHA|nr:gametocyte-specific factor 1-like [Clupea harengus]